MAKKLNKTAILKRIQEIDDLVQKEIKEYLEKQGKKKKQAYKNFFENCLTHFLEDDYTIDDLEILDDEILEEMREEYQAQIDDIFDDKIHDVIKSFDYQLIRV